MTVFAHSQTTNNLVNEAANDSAWVSRQDRKIPPTLGTNQIAGFGGCRPLASLGKNKKPYEPKCIRYGRIVPRPLLPEDHNSRHPSLTKKESGVVYKKYWTSSQNSELKRQQKEKKITKQYALQTDQRLNSNIKQRSNSNHAFVAMPQHNFDQFIRNSKLLKSTQAA